MPLSFPIRIRHDPMRGQPPAYFENLQLWWQIAEHVFKFVGWCLVTGLVGSAAIKSKNHALIAITGGLAFILFMICLKISVTKFHITLDEKYTVGRISNILLSIISIFITLSVMIGGLYLSFITVNALLNVQTVAQ